MSMTYQASLLFFLPAAELLFGEAAGGTVSSD